MSCEALLEGGIVVEICPLILSNNIIADLVRMLCEIRILTHKGN